MYFASVDFVTCGSQLISSRFVIDNVNSKTLTVPVVMV